MENDKMILILNGIKYKLVPFESNDNSNDRFDKLFNYILKVEGGYVNNPLDNGGATNYGITQAIATKYNIKNVSNMTKEQAKNIYKQEFYLKNNLDKITNDKVALSIFDWVVNSGVWALKKAQVAVNNLEKNNNLEIDGKLGTLSINAINSIYSEDFLKEYHRIQALFYQVVVNNNNKMQVFLKGWLNRIKIKEQFLKEMN